MTKKVSNEELIAAMMQHGTIKAAANAAGISPRTIYDRMQEPEFIKLYENAKSEIIRDALFNLNGKLANAIETEAEIMNDRSGETPQAVRLQAAQAIINHAAKFAERLNANETKAAETNQMMMTMF